MEQQKKTGKEVKNQSEEVKKISLLDITNSIKKGKNPTQIAKDFGISKQRLNYYLSTLKAKGIIKRVGYGVWEIDPVQEVKISTQHTSPQPDHVRGHAFIWKVQAKHINISWKEYLDQKQIPYKLVGMAKVPRIEVKGKKIWLGQKNIVIFDSDSFFAKNALESRKLAVFSLLQTLKALQTILGIEIKDFRFTPRREHYSLIKNALAIQCNEKGEKISVYNEKGQWLVIDDSLGLGELENVGPDAFATNPQLQKWWNEQKETKFQVTPNFIMNTMNGIQQNQLIFAENMKSHIEAIQKLGNAVEKLTQKIEELK